MQDRQRCLKQLPVIDLEQRQVTSTLTGLPASRPPAQDNALAGTSKCPIERVGFVGHGGSRSQALP
jgi:hypothetical protein